jgi:hypothetical protein
MNASYTEAISKLIQMHLDSSKIYQEVTNDIKFEKLNEFFADFHKKHIAFAHKLKDGLGAGFTEDLVEHAPLRRREDELFEAVRTDNEFSVYELCLTNERQLMKRYEDALAINDDPGAAFHENLETISTIVRRLERAKTVPAVKNILVDL